MNLVDRGILTELDQLVDPADDKPRRVKTGTGERVKVSYTIGRTESLPSEVRGRFPKDCEYFLYTRGAWHRFGREKARICVGLTPEGPCETVYIRESEWQK